MGYCVLPGRQFYKCPKRSDSGDSCGFFLWADNQETAPPPLAAMGTGSNGHTLPGSTPSQQPGFLMAPGRRGRDGASRRGGGASGRSRESVVLCSCGEEAVERTVQKEGPNKGRQFFVCPKPRDQQCQFFEWSSEESARNHSTTSRGGRGAHGHPRRGRGASRGSKSSRAVATDGESGDLDGAKRKRAPPTCSLCGEVGHTKRTCPHNH